MFVRNLLIVGLFALAPFTASAANLTEVTWKHAVNSQAELTAALADAKLQMIEADVAWGQVTDADPKEDKPIMAHPKDDGTVDASDLSLEDFLKKIVEHNAKDDSQKKGVKLDFKSDEALIGANDLLTANHDKITAFWVNADILKGPKEASAPTVTPVAFTNALTPLTKAVASVGWTTKEAADAAYSTEDVDAAKAYLMASKLANAVTFAVRAGFAARSADQMEALLKTSDKATLTVWASDPADEVDTDKLTEVILKAGVDRVYVDVGKDLREKLGLGGDGSYAASVRPSGVLFGLSAFVLTLAVFKRA